MKHCLPSVSGAALTFPQLLAIASFGRGASPRNSSVPSCACGARSPNESQKQLLAHRTAHSLIEPMRGQPSATSE